MIVKEGRNSTDKSDGVAIFFKTKRFNLINEPFIVFHTDGHDRITLITSLYDNETNSPLLILGTHLYWNSLKVEDQIQELSETQFVLEQLIPNIQKSLDFKSSIPIIFCGDFNSVPSSKIYKFMSEKFLSNLKYKMRSSYDIYSSKDIEKEYGDQYEPLFTTVTHKRCETIDYIWYSQDHFQVSQLLEIPDEKTVREKQIDEYKGVSGIPNSKFGSDHLPIQVVLNQNLF